MTDLRSVSEEALQAELERRKTPTIPLPQIVSQPNFQTLVQTITEGVAQSIANGYEDDDFRYYVYEAAITAVYGPGYWEWRRAQKW